MLIHAGVWDPVRTPRCSHQALHPPLLRSAGGTPSCESPRPGEEEPVNPGWQPLPSGTPGSTWSGIVTRRGHPSWSGGTSGSAHTCGLHPRPCFCQATQHDTSGWGGLATDAGSRRGRVIALFTEASKGRLGQTHRQRSWWQCTMGLGADGGRRGGQHGGVGRRRSLCWASAWGALKTPGGWGPPGRLRRCLRCSLEEGTTGL